MATTLITEAMRNTVATLYPSLFGRAADADGLGYWTSQVAAKGVEAVAQDMYNVAPARAYYPLYLTNSEIVAKFYVNVLGRPADQQGLDYWTAQLNSGKTQGQVIVNMINAVNAYNGTDADALNSKALLANKMAVSLYYGITLNGTATSAVATSIVANVNSDPASVATAEATAYATLNPPAPAPVGQTFTLTTGIDFVTGTSAGDTINGTAATNTLTGLDSIDGGDGSDKLNITSVAAVTTTGATVKNVETATLTSAADVNSNTTSWTGLTALNVVSSATANETITAAATTVVKVANGTAFDVTVVGSGGAISISNDVGGNVNVGQSAVANAITSATVSGGLAVAVRDRSGTAAASGSTLTTVSLDGNAGAATLTGNGITSVTEANTNQNLTVTAAAATRALGVTVNTVTGGTITDATATTATLTSTGAANVVADLAVAAATAVTLAGDKALALTTTHFDAATSLNVSDAALVTISGYATTNKLASVKVTGAGGLTTDLSGQGAQLTSIDASGSTGPNTITINGTEAYKGGSGVDIVTASAAPTLAVDGGAGTADVFVMNAASFSLTKVTGFETLGAGANATGAYSAAGFTGLTEGAVAGAITWNTVAAGTTLAFTASPGAATTYTLATDTATDVLNVTLKSAGVLAAGSLAATLVETINVTVTDTDTTKHVDTLTIADTALTTLTVKGNAGLTLTNTNTTLTSVDASGVSNTAGTAATGFSWTSGALAAAATIKGTATGGDVINAAAAVAAVTITETAGTNTITGSSTIASTLTGGSGADVITGGAGKDVIVGGGGADVITGGAGADSITLSGVTAKIVQAALGDSGVNSSTTIQTAELTSTFDIIKGMVAGDKVQLFTNTPAVNLSAVNLAGTDDVINFARGTYDGAAGTFTYAANGADTAMTYDTTVGAGSAFETIILVGYATGTTTAVAAGLITLA